MEDDNYAAGPSHAYSPRYGSDRSSQDSFEEERCSRSRKSKRLQSSSPSLPQIYVQPPSEDNSILSDNVVDDIALASSQPRDSLTGSNGHKNTEDASLNVSDIDIQKKSLLKKMVVYCIWIICCITLMMVERDSDLNKPHQISVAQNITRSYYILQNPTMRQVEVELQGAILPPYYANLTTKFMKVWVELIQLRNKGGNISEDNILLHKTISTVWQVPIVFEESIDFAPEVRQTKLFNIDDIDFELLPQSIMCLQFNTNLRTSFPISVSFDLAPINPEDGIVYAAIILVGVYLLIVLEFADKTSAAMLAATTSIAVLAMFGERPSHQEIISWVDLETLTLLFSMMTVVTIITETQLFNYLSLAVYLLGEFLTRSRMISMLFGGQLWVVIDILCIMTVLVSSFMDNVATILLMTPVTIKLCEVMKLNASAVLVPLILFSNIGGAITPIGEPPNVIITNNKDVIESGITFAVFTLHMAVAIGIIIIFVNCQLRFIFRGGKGLRFKEPAPVQELKHEIVIWRRTAASISSYSKEEDLVKESLYRKAQRLVSPLKAALSSNMNVEEQGTCGFERHRETEEFETLEEVKQKFNLKGEKQIHYLIPLLFIIVTVCLQSSLNLHLSLGSIAFLGALLLLLMYDGETIGVITRIEWGTLMFFTFLFIMIEGLARLGLIEYVGSQTVVAISAVPPDYRLAAAIILVLWVSGLASCFLDNIPLTTMMIHIAVGLSQTEELNLPLPPLVWALSLGACLGGNGTLFGSSSNLVCATVAEKHGHKLTFVNFSRIGFPVMLWSLSVATVYLMIAHVWFNF